MIRFSFKALTLAGFALALSVSQCTIFQDITECTTCQTVITNLGTCEDPPIGNPTDPTTPPEISKKDLYAWFPFNGNADDESGNKHHGNVSGATLVSDRFGFSNSAYQFDGTNDYIIAKNIADFPKGTPERTIAGWFKSSNKDPYIMMLFGLGATRDSYNFQVGVGPNYENDKTEFRVNGWGDSYDWRTGVKANDYMDGVWHHCAVTYDGTYTRIYFDGVLKNLTYNFTYNTLPEEMVLVIGHEIDLAGWEWNGAIDDVAIYTRTLSEEEIVKMASGAE